MMSAAPVGEHGLPQPVISIESPHAAGVAELIAASDAFSARFYPPESCYGAPIEALAAPSVRFFVARIDGLAVGCGGYAIDPTGWAEIKRLVVAEAARGFRLGAALMHRIEMEATADGIGSLRLETGIHNHAALKLYRAMGYIETGPFGGYGPDPMSVFMEKRLA